MIKLNGMGIDFKKFPNNETLLTSEMFFGAVYPEHVNTLSLKFEGDEDLIRLMFVKNYLDRHFLKTKLIIEYMPYSRMDRSENGSPFTLKDVAQFINGLNFRQVLVVEPHSDVTCALLDNSEAVYINFELIEKVKELTGFNQEKDYLVFPDAGAKKRYAKMESDNVLFCNKVRDFETGKIDKLDLVGDTSKAYGRTAIIVDDLSSYGGTFIKTADRLREEGFVEVILLVAHAENVIFKRNDRTGKLLFEHVEKIFTTDSILTQQNNWENKKFAPQIHIFDLDVDVDMLK